MVNENFQKVREIANFSIVLRQIYDLIKNKGINMKSPQKVSSAQGTISFRMVNGIMQPTYIDGNYSGSVIDIDAEIFKSNKEMFLSSKKLYEAIHDDLVAKAAIDERVLTLSNKLDSERTELERMKLIVHSREIALTSATTILDGEKENFEKKRADLTLSLEEKISKYDSRIRKLRQFITSMTIMELIFFTSLVLIFVLLQYIALMFQPINLILVRKICVVTSVVVIIIGIKMMLSRLKLYGLT